MQNFLKTKLFYTLASLLALVVIALAAVKILSARTYDPANPRSKPNSYLLTHAVEVDLPADQVFDFITYETQHVWQQIADEHAGETFEIINADGMTLGAVMLCEEYAAGEGTSHRYVVKEVIDDRLIHFASEPSIVYRENRAGEMQQVTTANAYVYYDLEPLATDKTKLTMTLVIQMPNFLVKFVTDVLGGEEGKTVWQGHLEEELTGLVRFMVADASGNAIDGG